MRTFKIAICCNDIYERFELQIRGCDNPEEIAVEQFKQKYPMVVGRPVIYSSERVVRHGKTEMMRKRIEQQMQKINEPAL